MNNYHHHYNVSGQLHREDGPAIEYANGTKYWYINGAIHREDGPAIEYANGSKAWFINGQRKTGVFEVAGSFVVTDETENVEEIAQWANQFEVNLIRDGYIQIRFARKKHAALFKLFWM